MDAMENLDYWFKSFSKHAWRLEVLDDYTGTDGEEELLEFQRTGVVPPRTPEHPWRRIIETARSRGAEIGRTRLIGHPITPYTEYELAAYEDNVMLGEDVRIMDRERLDASWDAAPDVWIFDDEAAFEMLYGDRGTFQGVREVDPAPFIRVRSAVMPLAVPVRIYMRESEKIERPVPLTLPAALAA